MSQQTVIIHTDTDHKHELEALGLTSATRRALLLELGRDPRGARVALETLRDEIELVMLGARQAGDPTIEIAANVIIGRVTP